MMNLGSGLQGLQDAVAVRLRLEGFEYELNGQEDGFQVIVKRCPWHDMMTKSGRQELSGKVSDLICRVENSVWSSEFKDTDANLGEIKFERRDRICEGSSRCELLFFRQAKRE
jgi:hypothetical protein